MAIKNYRKDCTRNYVPIYYTRKPGKCKIFLVSAGFLPAGSAAGSAPAGFQPGLRRNAFATLPPGFGRNAFGTLQLERSFKTSAGELSAGLLSQCFSLGIHLMPRLGTLTKPWLSVRLKARAGIFRPGRLPLATARIFNFTPAL